MDEVMTLTNRWSQPLAGAMTSLQHVYEVRRKDHRGVDLISDVLAFGRLWLRRTVAAVRFILTHFVRTIFGRQKASDADATLTV
jgi:hypothetical protein